MNIDAARIIESLHSHKLIDGLTHNFYNYPARFSPELAREIIKNFSNSTDWIFDPFMGGGTSIVESLAMGRNALGVDINSLAWFVAICKTTPVSANDIAQLRNWISNIDLPQLETYPSFEVTELNRHFPKEFLRVLDALLESIKGLESRKAKLLARLIMLRVYQSALSSQNGYPTAKLIRQKIIFEAEKIVSGLQSFFTACKEAGFNKKDLVTKRRLLNRSCIGIETENKLRDLNSSPRLVFTSPPYPGVHVLYNKWQIASRKETYLPYYISQMNDSQPESYYTFGGRSQSGVDKYFELVTQSFLSISKVIYRKALIVQLVGFSNTSIQLPLYLSAMKRAGYREIFPLSEEGKRHWRDVPNRKWYTSIRDNWDSSREVLLFHEIDQKT